MYEWGEQLADPMYAVPMTDSDRRRAAALRDRAAASGMSLEAALAADRDEREPRPTMEQVALARFLVREAEARGLEAPAYAQAVLDAFWQTGTRESPRMRPRPRPSPSRTAVRLAPPSEEPKALTRDELGRLAAMLRYVSDHWDPVEVTASGGRRQAQGGQASRAHRTLNPDGSVGQLASAWLIRVAHHRAGSSRLLRQARAHGLLEIEQAATYWRYVPLPRHDLDDRLARLGVI